MGEKKITDQGISAIDKALAAAKARKEAKSSGNTTTSTDTNGGTGTTSAAPKRAKATDAERAAKQAQIENERTERKQKRDEERAQKLAAKNQDKQPAHMRKVQKAAEKIGALGQSAQLLFDEATHNLTAAELATLALHIQHFNRVKATERAGEAEVAVGQTVEIVDGEPRFIGKVGTVVKSQRIRCYVNIEGCNNRPVPGTDSTGIYFFTSDVKPVAQEIAAEDTDTLDEETTDTQETEQIAATG